MKTMFKTIALILAGIFVCDTAELVAQSYFQKNVAITNARVRSLNATTYVRELLLVDFAKQEPLMGSFGFRTDGFFDDGQGNDAKAGDGIYTSRNTYEHSGSVPYLREQPVRSVVSGPITDYAFLHDQALNNNIQGGGGKTALAAGPGIKVKLVRCSCPQECRCLACDWGWTNWCLAVEEVEIEIGW
jgi:hypothetical protein